MSWQRFNGKEKFKRKKWKKERAEKRPACVSGRTHFYAAPGNLGKKDLVRADN